MDISRRAFASGALGVALSSRFATPAFAQGSPGLTAAIAAIQAHGAQHLRTFGLPGMTLALTVPGGLAPVLNFGFANADSRRPITPDTLFQVGSISKAMTAAVIHQLVAEKRLTLGDRVSTLLPAVPLPRGNTITVQHLLDHSAGLPDDAPLFPDGGLWVGYQPGEHWHYSNTGYHLLGDIAAHVGGKPLAQLLTERLLRPLGMRRSRGAIVAADRPLYAQGYEPVDLTVPVVRGGPLAPAAWVDMTFGSGCVASTGDDMIRWMRSLAEAAQGRGGFGLSPEQGRAFIGQLVHSDTPGMSYGNGLMHVGGNGRAYLHHTGGMVSFSSSFHLDPASGVGAFASSTISAFAEYRPRQLTQFAVDALAEVLAGRAVPAAPSLETPLPNAVAYIGRYAGPAGKFEIRAGSPLTLVANGREAAIEPAGGELFRTTHPDFRAFTLMFERKGTTSSGVNWGAASYVREGSNAAPAPSNPALARLAGRFVNDSPWWGTLAIVERGGALWLGTETPLTNVGDNLWRVGPEAWTPERAAFADFVDGRPQTFIFSGEKFLRHEV